MPDTVSEQTTRGNAAAAAAHRSPLTTTKMAAGFVAPIIGRIALRDVNGYFNLPLIRKGETVDQSHIDRSQYLGRLYELIAATEIE